MAEDAHGDRVGVARLQQHLRLARRFAEDEPIAVGRRGAAQEEHALVVDLQLEDAVAAGGELAEVGFGELERQLGGPQRLGVGGEAFQELAQAAVEIGVGGGLAGGAGKVEPADAAEERRPDTLHHEGTSLLPVVVARQGELVEVDAGLAVGKEERAREGEAAGVQGALLAVLGEGPAVVVAIVGVRRVGRFADGTADGRGVFRIARARGGLLIVGSLGGREPVG